MRYVLALWAMLMLLAASGRPAAPPDRNGTTDWKKAHAHARAGKPVLLRLEVSASHPWADCNVFLLGRDAKGSPYLHEITRIATHPNLKVIHVHDLGPALRLMEEPPPEGARVIGSARWSHRVHLRPARITLGE